MSYTFSRRDFMKYTALTAVAIAGSGMLTGCSNPNRPVGKAGDTLKPGDGICEATVLNSAGKEPRYDPNTKTLTCNFKIVTKIELLLRARSTIIIIPILSPVWAIPLTPKLARTASPRPL